MVELLICIEVSLFSSTLSYPQDNLSHNGCSVVVSGARVHRQLGLTFHRSHQQGQRANVHIEFSCLEFMEICLNLLRYVDTSSRIPKPRQF